MKKLLIIALLCGSAYADTVATLRNKSGGLIVLTDVPTDTCKGFTAAAYATTENNKTLWGCWFSDDLMVHVRWDDGDTRAYPISAFDIDAQKARRLKERNSRRGGDV